ncbi:MAG: hypothetical protein JKY16_00875 [Lutibacter sp.]|nr:hypothetical protein [Lutibacter sp.]
MKFKTINKLVLLIASFTVMNIAAQNNSIKLKGTVQSDSTYLSDINIVNKTSNLGTFSKKNGTFNITTSLGDSILFSSIVYNNRIVIISETHINSKKITVYLEPNYNQLDEIMLEKKIAIDWGNVAVPKGTIFENDKITNRKAPNARKLTDPNANASGLNPITIITALIKILTKKSRLKRKAKKIEHEKIKQLKNKFPITIRDLYGIYFFVEWLHIPEDNLNLFLDYCEGNGLNDLYNSNEFIIKNFLIVQAEKFNSIRN